MEKDDYESIEVGVERLKLWAWLTELAKKAWDRGDMEEFVSKERERSEI